MSKKRIGIVAARSIYKYSKRIVCAFSKMKFIRVKSGDLNPLDLFLKYFM
ncbi:MAG: hypothetical protein HOO10_04855 [Candidatus Marinimicrobia bacterium]|nr:hypothetical protein [Candidatus Neomarinimicrobiota bacterium]